MKSRSASCWVTASFFVSIFAVVHPPALAQSISFDPPEGNPLTPMTVVVDGFIGTNGPAPVSINGSGISGSCSTARPCTFAANMGYFSGKHWVEASGLVNGVAITVSNFFFVRSPVTFLNLACGTNGAKVTVSGYDFGRNQTVYVDNNSTLADTNGRFAITITIPEGPGGLYQIISQDGFHFTTNMFTIGTNMTCAEEPGHITGGGGGLTIGPPGGPWRPLRPGDPVHAGDEIRTGPDGNFRLTLTDGTTLTAQKNSRVALNDYFFTPANGAADRSSVGFFDGALKYVSGLLAKRKDNATVSTDYAVLGIRGTEFITRRDPCSTTQEVYLIHGQLSVKPLYATVTNVIDAPAAIFYDATNVWTNVLTQSAYNILAAEINETNPAVTFGSWLTGYFGCTNQNAFAVPDADPDADGQNNLAEFLCHTDPTTNGSVFKLVGAAREGNGVRLTWQTHGGVTNVIQAAGSLSGTFTNLGDSYAIPGNEDILTNFLDQDILVNASTRFYRVQLAE